MFTRKALALACAECGLDSDLLRPATQVQLASGESRPVDEMLVEQTMDLFLALAH